MNLTSMSARMMRRSFEKTRYQFTEIPAPQLRGNFGVYLHVPFCHTLCSFCPFYKERYTDADKAAYLQAVLREIAEADMSGRARWLYIGGGTPNTLSLDDLAAIFGALRQKITLEQVGMELLPALVTADYLRGLHALGVTKISVGVESLADSVITPTGRTAASGDMVTQLLAEAAPWFWTNVDLMVGLPHQTTASFQADVRAVAAMAPSQITIYPFMVIRGLQAQASMSDAEQFTLIDRVYDEILAPLGYARPGIWGFTRGSDLYDSSRDELVEDYIGFGPAAFSTYNGWKVVNPDLRSYLKGWENGGRRGFVAAKAQSTDDWRRFAAMLYDLRCRLYANAPGYIRAYIRLLEWTGYGRRGIVTEKGRRFAHVLTKTVVESLPFPVQNPAVVENYSDYLAYREKIA